MTTRYSPDRRSIGNVLSMTNPPVVVPDWQRNYSWTTSEIDTFWQDILHFDEQYPGDNVDSQEYFLGAIVIVDCNRTHLLLDGQQRLATAAVLLSVIRDFLDRYSRDAAVRISTRYLTDFDDALGDYSFKITLNRYDREFFRREVLETRGARYEVPTPTLESHRLIRRAREFFAAAFESKYASMPNPEEAHQWALHILKLLTNHVSVVAVITEDEDNAANVFETLNDRGIGLSTPDLLRNLILRRSSDTDRDTVGDLWGEILEIEGDAKLQEFLRHYWLSHQGDVKARSLYREIKQYIQDGDIESLAFTRQLCDSSVVYRDIVSSHHEDREIASLLSDINDLGAKMLYPPILSAFEQDNEPGLRDFIWALLVTFVRHSLICQRENSRLENVAYSLARDIRKGDIDLAASTERLRVFTPDNDTFRQSFRTVSLPRRASARYVLRVLEMAMRTTEELDVAPPPRVHVEHIYPQTPQEGHRWDRHSEFLNRLGNLTLLSRRLNTTIRNSPFDIKRPYYERSELLITKALAASSGGWNEDLVIARQEQLATQAVTIWYFPEATER